MIATDGAWHTNLMSSYKSTINDSPPGDLQLDGLMFTVLHGRHALVERSRRLKGGG